MWQLETVSAAYPINIHVKNVKDWHIHFCKTFDHQIWTISTSGGVDTFEND